MAEPREALTAKQLALVAALLLAPTVKAAARRAKVAYRTAVRWRALPQFRAAHDAAVKDTFGRGLGMVQAAAPRAAQRLVKALKAAKTSDAISAARALLDHGGKAAGLADLETKLAEAMRLLEELRSERDQRRRQGS
jgi:hypothetical protein